MDEWIIDCEGWFIPAMIFTVIMAGILTIIETRGEKNVKLNRTRKS